MNQKKTRPDLPSVNLSLDQIEAQRNNVTF